MLKFSELQYSMPQESTHRIGILEKTDTSLKKTLKIAKNERRTMWHKYVNVAVLNYNMSYHANIGCEPNKGFHGRILYNILDLIKSINRYRTTTPNSQIAQNVLEQTE